MQIDRRTEDLILRAVAAAGIGAPVLSQRPGPARAGHALSGAGVDAHGRLRRARHFQTGWCPARLHSLAVPDGVRVVDLAASVDGYLATLNERGVETPLRTDALRKRAHSYAASLNTGAAICLCHNDVHHSTSSTMAAASHRLGIRGHRRADTSIWHRSASITHTEPASARDLLAAYEADGHSQSTERLELCCWLFEYIRDLWFEVRDRHWRAVPCNGLGARGSGQNLLDRSNLDRTRPYRYRMLFRCTQQSRHDTRALDFWPEPQTPSPFSRACPCPYQLRRCTDGM